MPSSPTLLAATARLLVLGSLFATAFSLAQSPPPPTPAAELKTGSDLTRKGLFAQALPHLIAARGHGADPYASGINLSICYLGLGQYDDAVRVLSSLRSSGSDTPAVENLLTQAYLGEGQTGPAWQTFQSVVARTPEDETLYAFIADACTDHNQFALGLRVAETGLLHLSDSARLHYERAVFLARLDRLPEARPEFDRAAQLAPGSYIASLALVQKALYDDDLPQATSLLRQAVLAGNRDYRTLSLLGTVLLQAGAAPGQSSFTEAQSTLEESARLHPNYSATQLALGKLDMTLGHFAEARDHLEIARRMEPQNPAVYSNLAHAYRRLGDSVRAQQMQEKLARLLAAQHPTSTPAIP